MRFTNKDTQVQNRVSTTAPEPGLNVWLTYGALLLVAALAWLGVLLQSNSMAGPARSEAGIGMSGSAGGFDLAGAISFLAAWTVMMAAMMLPSAAPMLVMYGSLSRNFARSGQQGLPTVAFTLLYLAVWTGLGVPVYVANQAIQSLAEGNAWLARSLPYALAVTLVAAGIYQFSPLKLTCLRACRSPMSFLLGHWRGGYAGTAQLALQHALYCAGCCWALMIVLVAAGAMALHWVLAIAALVLAEKLLPYDRWTSRLIGGGLVILGLLVAFEPGIAGVLRGQMAMGA